MYIGEIPEGSAIDIYVASNTEDKKISLCTFARIPNNPTDEKLVNDYFKKYMFGSGILADPIEKNGKYVSFNVSEDSQVKVFCTIDKKPYLWNKVKIITAVFKKETYYLIMSNQNAKQTNRRTSFRQWVGSDGSVKLKSGMTPQNAIIKDVSTGGVGLILDIRDEGFEVGDRVTINYTDKVGTGRGLSKEFNFSLNASVIRVDDSNHRDKIVGCKFDKPNESIGQYINMKQIEHKKQIKIPPRKK